MFNTDPPNDSLMIRNFVGGGFKIQSFYCKTFYNDSFILHYGKGILQSIQKVRYGYWEEP